MRKIKFLSDNIETIFSVKIHDNEIDLYICSMPYQKAKLVKDNIYVFTHYWDDRNKMWIETSLRERIMILD